MEFGHTSEYNSTGHGSNIKLTQVIFQSRMIPYRESPAVWMGTDIMGRVHIASIPSVDSSNKEKSFLHFCCNDFPKSHYLMYVHPTTHHS